MKRSALVGAALWVTGMVGGAWAQETLVTEKITPDVSTMEENHPMIFELRDRIQNQRDRINRGVDDNTITMEVATTFRGVLESVEKQMKIDYKSNGSEKLMKLTRDQFITLNTLLDSNSKTIHEMKQTFYYYDPYFNHYYDDLTVSDASSDRVPALEESHPMIFELRDRIRNQRDRIDEGLKAKTLSEDQAASCREVLQSVEKKMGNDYKSNGQAKRMKLTREQYLACNTTLDTNSIAIHEGKQFFYFYGPYYNQYWF